MKLYSTNLMVDSMRGDTLQRLVMVGVTQITPRVLSGHHLRLMMIMSVSFRVDFFVCRHTNILCSVKGWYTENLPNNRMLLALRSGIDSEVAWALDRLCRLCVNELFTLAGIPGLLDALFEWPEWFIDEYGFDLSQSEDVLSIRTGGDVRTDADLFRLSKSTERRCRHALESLLIMRTAALTETNAVQLAAHLKTRKLIVRALTELNTNSDATTEFLLSVIDILQSIAGSIVLPSLKAARNNSDLAKLVPALERLAGESKNRSVIIASLTALTSLFNNPQNAAHTNASSGALSASIRYLPLLQDVPLVDACINFLYSHLAYPPMTKAFLMHPDMPATLKLLVGLIISQQVEEKAVKDISAPKHMAPVVKVKSIPFELVGADLERIGSLSETERCFEWYVRFSYEFQSSLTITIQDEDHVCFRPTGRAYAS